MMPLRPAPFAALLVLFSAIVLVGVLPGQAEALSSHVGDKPLHVLAYAALSVLAHQSLSAPRTARALASLLIVSMLGLLDESLQSLLPYRNASLADWCFDIVAAFLSCSALWLWADDERAAP